MLEEIIKALTMTFHLQLFYGVRKNWKCLLEFLTILSKSYKNCAPIFSPPWVSASIDPTSSVLLGAQWNGSCPGPHPGLSTGRRAQ